MNKVMLIILDGFGEGKPYAGNAITLAKTPFITKLRQEYPWTLLKCSGEAIGLPEGTQGGSEVGHFTIGAGRVVVQFLEEINRGIRNSSLFNKPELIEACRRANSNDNTALHLLGMISDQGIHSDIKHLFALLEFAKQQGVKKVFIHAITDGRDVPERSAAGFIKQIQRKIMELGMEKTAFIATLIGRFFAMDRDQNWDREQKAYDLYTLGKGIAEKDPVQAVENAYRKGIATDYYIDSIILNKNSVIKDNDSVIFWNFRADRSRQLTWLFTGEPSPDTGKPPPYKPEKPVRPYFVCLGPYSEKAPVLFHPPVINNNLGETIAKQGLKQFRIAETDKFAHTTFFFNSEKERPCEGEDRLLVNSPKCPSYAEKPEMSANELSNAVLPKIASGKYALIVINYANGDLVGHSGDLKAAVKAVETLDKCLTRVVPEGLKNGYCVMVTADHGNCEYMIYEENGRPCPSHTKNPVPFILVSKKGKKYRLRSQNAELDDIAPTILQLMNIEKPPEMTGESLIKNTIQ